MRSRAKLDWQELLQIIEQPHVEVARCLNMEFDLTGDLAKESLKKILEARRMGDTEQTRDGKLFVRFSEMLFFTIEEKK